MRAALGRLIREIQADPEVSATYYLPGGRFVDSTARNEAFRVNPRPPPFSVNLSTTLPYLRLDCDLDIVLI